MNLKTVIFGMSLIVFSAQAFADNYECLVKPNPNRGFADAFEVKVTRIDVGGLVFISNGTQSEAYAKVVGANSLNRNDQAFAHTLNTIGEADVSGRKPGDEPATVLKFFQAKRLVKENGQIKRTADGKEVLVEESEIFIYQIMAGSKQIGGTLFIDGLATACLPKRP